MKHMRLADFDIEQNNYSLIVRCMLQLLQSDGSHLALLAMLQVFDDMFSHTNPKYQEAYVKALRANGCLTELLDAFEQARTRCKETSTKPDHYELLLKSGLRLVCSLGDKDDEPALVAKHLLLALAQPVPLLNAAFRRDANFDQLIGGVFAKLHHLSGLQSTSTLLADLGVPDMLVHLLKTMLSSSRSA